MTIALKAKWALFAFVAAALILPAAMWGQCAAADSWPNRPVRFIVTLGPGSGVDIAARLLADKLSARWSRPVVVENRPGGDGIIAITSFLGAHDGHSLLVAYRSPSLILAIRFRLSQLRTKLRWLLATPFGRPVEPEV